MERRAAEGEDMTRLDRLSAAHSRAESAAEEAERRARIAKRGTKLLRLAEVRMARTAALEAHVRLERANPNPAREERA